MLTLTNCPRKRSQIINFVMIIIVIIIIIIIIFAIFSPIRLFAVEKNKKLSTSSNVSAGSGAGPMLMAADDTATATILEADELHHNNRSASILPHTKCSLFPSVGFKRSQRFGNKTAAVSCCGFLIWRDLCSDPSSSCGDFAQRVSVFAGFVRFPQTTEIVQRVSLLIKTQLICKKYVAFGKN